MMGYRAPFVFGLGLVLIATTAFTQEAAEVTLTTPDDVPVTWSVWIGDHGPAAVLLWGSWTPESDAVLADTVRIQSIAIERGFNFVIVALQERREASRSALGDRQVTWFHDRHGALLKALRVYNVPSLVVVTRDGSVLGRIVASSQALSSWEEQ